MTRFPEAQVRLFQNKFVCKRCKSTVRSPNMKVLAGKVSCQKCNSKALKPVRKK
ncbi:50S ribosomal protein L40e [Candidatus Woesearchaeota archaeon]|nr:50S ribosomal protein L40e [Candidatus Woesearchaeota archaeon]